MDNIEFSDIQGLVFYGHAHLPYAAYFPLRVTDAVRARGFIARLVESGAVTNAEPRARSARAPSALQLALSAAGLRMFGVSEDALMTFSREFVDGMAQRDRARILGDVGANAPDHWEFGHDAAPVHVLVCVFHATERALDDDVARCMARLEADGLALVTPEPLCGTLRPQEHFGFRDGISQPAIAGAPREASSPQRAVQPGEFVLDYVDEYGVRSMPPSVFPGDDREHRLPARDGRHLLGRNGSYLVLRKLEQDVAGFWSYAAQQARRIHGGSSPETMEAVAAKMVGRWRNGDALVPGVPRTGPDEKPTNNFTYRDDVRGRGCPLGAHVRRVNPRDALPPDPGRSLLTVSRHRIIRRGRSYGPPFIPGAEIEDDRQRRGLVFICLNADLRRQFEFVQQSWVTSPTFGGLIDEEDPLLGPRRANGFTIPQAPYRHRFEAVPQFVRMCGGGYFFLPGLRALGWLVGSGASTNVVEVDDDPKLHVLRELWRSALAGAKLTGDEAENLFELTAEHVLEWSSKPQLLRPLFAALREHCPILVAPKFALVTRHADVQEVLANRTGAFRVTEVYAKQMHRTSGDFMLGMENTEQYRREARIARAALGDDYPGRIRAIVIAEADRRLDAARGRIDLVSGYTRAVASHVVQEYFGVSGPDTATLMQWMRVIFWGIFLNPFNLPSLQDSADAASREMSDYLNELIAERKRSPRDDLPSRLLALQRDPETRLDDEAIRRNVGGIILGAVETTSKAASQAIAWLIDHPQHLATASMAAVANDADLVKHTVFEALRFSPQMPLLARFCGADTPIARGTPREKVIRKGTMVLVATLSASFDPAAVVDPEAFRTDRDDIDAFHFGYGQHRCFGYRISRVQVPELAARLLRRSGVRRANGANGEMTYEGPFPDHMDVEFAVASGR